MAKPTHPPTPRPRYRESTIMWDSYVRAFLINQKRSMMVLLGCVSRVTEQETSKTTSASDIARVRGHKGFDNTL